MAGATNVRIIDTLLSKPDMTGLIAASDIVISLHRSEGFGLVPAEAMALGKPVVATAWSGNIDFMTERNSALVTYTLVPVIDPEHSFSADGQCWADANIDHAAEWLSRLGSNAELRERMGAAARADVTRQLSPERFAHTIEALLGSKAPAIRLG